MILPLAIFALTCLAVSGVRTPRLEIDRTTAALVGAAAMVAVGGLPIGVGLSSINLERLLLELRLGI